MSKILIVEDEFEIAKFIRLELEHEGFETQIASTGRQAIDFCASGKYDLILLDVMIPELNGIEVLRRIRKTSTVPIILVTAKSETPDKVTGLDVGADDYITKPFEIEELLARIRALLRRSSYTSTKADQEVPHVLEFRKLKMDTDRLEVRYDGNLVNLTRTEFLILQCLLENKNHVVSREQIFQYAWGPEHYVDDNSVDVYIRYIRSKIDERFKDSIISTVRGAGYSIKD